MVDSVSVSRALSFAELGRTAIGALSGIRCALLLRPIDELLLRLSSSTTSVHVGGGRSASALDPVRMCSPAFVDLRLRPLGPAVLSRVVLRSRSSTGIPILLMFSVLLRNLICSAVKPFLGAIVPERMTDPGTGAEIGSARERLESLGMPAWSWRSEIGRRKLPDEEREVRPAGGVRLAVESCVWVG